MSADYKDLGIGKQKRSWKRTPRVPSKRLGDRERQVLSMLVSGMSQPLIAQHLGIAQSTLWQHVHSIKTRLGMENLVQVGVWAERNGYRAGQLPPDDQCSCGSRCDGRTCSGQGGLR